MDRDGETVVETAGINFVGIAEAFPLADMTRTVCNNPADMYALLGVEAASSNLLSEIRRVIEFGGAYLNLRHLQVLCELMTNRGQLMSITRHGINRLGHGFLKKATFEETQDILLDAAVNMEMDPLLGVSERIMLGQKVRLGTGCLSVFERAGASVSGTEILRSRSTAVRHVTQVAPFLY